MRIHRNGHSRNCVMRRHPILNCGQERRYAC